MIDLIVIHAMDSNSNLQFDISLVIPVFTANPGAISFSFSEKGNLPILPNIFLDGFDLTFNLAPVAKVVFKNNKKLLNILSAHIGHESYRYFQQKS